MARVAITEYAAKKLILGEKYKGVSVTEGSLDAVVEQLPSQNYIVKVDVGIKKRGKQGLIRVSVPLGSLKDAVRELFLLGHKRCVIEEMVSYEASAEAYLSLSLEREGVTLLYSPQGGMEVEDKSESIQRFFIPRDEVLIGETTVSVASIPVNLLLSKMQEYSLSFVEINPFIVQDGSFLPLDMAVEIDDARIRKLPLWIAEHIVDLSQTPAEQAVKAQSEMTSAALTLKTLNPNGGLLTLLSGGGASLVAMDSLVAAGLQEKIINYSEYSGAPTRDETRVYVETLLKLLSESSAEKKAILIAGGVANFTDIALTFEGIIDAFSNNLDTLKTQQVFVCVRRGGPNQEKGLACMQSFLKKNSIPHEVHGPELSLGLVGTIISPQV